MGPRLLELLRAVRMLKVERVAGQLAVGLSGRQLHLRGLALAPGPAQLQPAAQNDGQTGQLSVTNSRHL